MDRETTEALDRFQGWLENRLATFMAGVDTRIEAIRAEVTRPADAEPGGGANPFQVAEGAMLVRVRPEDRTRGILRRTHGSRGKLYHASRGWYEVDEATARELGQARQDANDPASPTVFDVCTAEEARTRWLQEQGQAGPGDPLNPLRPDHRGGAFGGPIRVEAPRVVRSGA